MKKYMVFLALMSILLLLTACGNDIGQSADESSFVQWFRIAKRASDDEEITERFFEHIGTVIGQSQTLDGVTATLNAALSDEQNLVLSITLDGEGLEDGCYCRFSSTDTGLLPTNLIEEFKSARPDVSDEELAEYVEFVGRGREFDTNRSNYVYDDDTNTAQLTLYLQYPVTGTKENILHLENIYQKDTVLLAGPYDFTFTIEPNELTRHYTGSVDLTTEDGTLLTITDVTVSAFYLEVDYICAVPYSPYISSSDRLWMTSIRANGEEMVPSRTSETLTQETEIGFKGRVSFNEYCYPLDPSTVEAVCVGGTWLELSELTHNGEEVS